MLSRASFAAAAGKAGARALCCSATLFSSNGEKSTKAPDMSLPSKPSTSSAVPQALLASAACAGAVWALDKYYGVLDFSRSEKQETTKRKSKNPVVPYKTSAQSRANAPSSSPSSSNGSKKKSKSTARVKKEIEALSKRLDAAKSGPAAASASFTQTFKAEEVARVTKMVREAEREAAARVAREAKEALPELAARLEAANAKRDAKAAANAAPSIPIVDAVPVEASSPAGPSPERLDLAALREEIMNVRAEAETVRRDKVERLEKEVRRDEVVERGLISRRGRSSPSHSPARPRAARQK